MVGAWAEALSRLAAAGLAVGIAPRPSPAEAHGSLEEQMRVIRAIGEEIFALTRPAGTRLQAVLCSFSVPELGSRRPSKGLGRVFPLRAAGGSSEAEVHRFFAWLDVEKVESLALIPAAWALDIELRPFFRGHDAPGAHFGRVAPTLRSPALFARGWVGPVARVALRRAAKWTVFTFGSRSAVALGPISSPSRGYAQEYATPKLLRTDVAAVRTAGVDDLILDGLAGALRRRKPEEWLEAYASGAPVTERSCAEVVHRTGWTRPPSSP